MIRTFATRTLLHVSVSGPAIQGLSPGRRLLMNESRTLTFVYSECRRRRRAEGNWDLMLCDVFTPLKKLIEIDRN